MLLRSAPDPVALVAWSNSRSPSLRAAASKVNERPQLPRAACWPKHVNRRPTCRGGAGPGRAAGPGGAGAGRVCGGCSRAQGVAGCLCTDAW
jgi:hypothetical protein